MTNTDFKNHVKRFLRRGLGQRGFLANSMKDTLNIFVYHEVSDTLSPFCQMYDLNVPPRLFAEQMRFIKDHFHIINPDQLLEGNYGTPAAMITFDDGMSSYFRQAVPIMEKEDIPSINFLNMAPIEGELCWSGLITYLTNYDDGFRKVLRRHYPVSRQVPDFLLCDSRIVNDYLKTIDFKSIQEKIRSFRGDFASVRDLDSVRDNHRIFFGNHLYNHYNAAKLSDDKLHEQYALNEKRVLRYRNGRSLFAYPFGQPESCFAQRQTALLRSWGAKAVFGSSGYTNQNGHNGFYDRMGITSGERKIEDILGRVQLKRFKTLLKRRAYHNESC